MTVALLRLRYCLFRTSRNGTLLQRTFHVSLPRVTVRPFLLSDIGEGETRPFLMDNSTHISQASKKYRSYNGSSSQGHASSNSTRFARSSLIKLLQRYFNLRILGANGSN